MAATEPYVRNQLYSIPLAELLPDPNQPRMFSDPAALYCGAAGRPRVNPRHLHLWLEP